jgi:hypothetical protein
MPLQAAYTAFGLSIRSDFLLPELMETKCGGRAAVTIRSEAIQPGSKALLEIEGVARYLVSGGTEIIVDPCPEADEVSIRLFLLGSVFGALLHQRGLLPLHASAIETPKGAVLFAGGSGNGKSALAAAFYTRGYRVIADEICVADPDCLPAFPRLMLWPDILDQTGLWHAGVRPARPNLKKFHVPLEKGFASEPSPVHSIYILGRDNAREVSVTPVSGFNKVAELAEVIYRRRFCAETDYFDRLTSLARHPVVRLSRSSSASLHETADLLERDFSR